MRLRFEYDIEFEVTDEAALTAGVPDPVRRPDNPLLESFSNISSALGIHLDRAVAGLPGLKLVGGGYALTPLNDDADQNTRWHRPEPL